MSADHCEKSPLPSKPEAEGALAEDTLNASTTDAPETAALDDAGVEEQQQGDEIANSVNDSAATKAPSNDNFTQSNDIQQLPANKTTLPRRISSGVEEFSSEFLDVSLDGIEQITLEDELTDTAKGDTVDSQPSAVLPEKESSNVESEQNIDSEDLIKVTEGIAQENTDEFPAVAPTTSTTSNTEQSLENCLLGITITPPMDENDNSSSFFAPACDYNIDIPYKDLTGTINLAQLRKWSSLGLPEDDCYRGMVWRLLIDYLPLDRTQWSTALDKPRQLYVESIQTWFASTAQYEVQNGQELQWKNSRSQRRRSSNSDSNDEIDQNTDSSKSSASVQLPQHLIDEWKSRGKDVHVLVNVTTGTNALAWSSNADDTAAINDFIDSAILLDEIRKDVMRTHSDLSFFLEPNFGHRRYSVLERILFTYAKYHTGIRYVQGMNEIVSAVYYVLARDLHVEWVRYAEVDTYYMMELLMADMRDVFMPSLDEADTGIQGRLLSLEVLLVKHDPQVQEHLKEVGVDISFFAIRWWTTLLSREFLLPDTIRLWDSMLASTHKDNFLKYVCVTMLMLVRDELLQADFSTALRLLQSYPPTHMDGLLESSRALWVYESQITLACHRGNITLHQALSVLKPPSTIIMAFGLKHGRIRSFMDRVQQTASSSTSPIWASSSSSSSANGDKRWKEAKVAVASSAQGLLGKANKFYQKYQTQWSSKDKISDGSEDEKMSGDDQAFAEGEDTIDVDQFLSPDDDIYLAAIQNVD